MTTASSSGADGAVFTYHRVEAPMWWAMTVLMCIELVTVHLLLSAWSRTGALILSAITLPMIAWQINFIRRMKHNPFVLHPDHAELHMRTLMSANVPYAAIKSIDGDAAAVARRAGGIRFRYMSAPTVTSSIARRPRGSRS